VLAGFAVVVVAAIPSEKAVGQGFLQIELVASGLTAPTAGTNAGDGSGRLFIADQPGQIRIIDSTPALLATPFLDLSGSIVPLGAFGDFDERGLLGLAFHTNYAVNGKFYVYYSVPAPAEPPIGPLDFDSGPNNTDPFSMSGAHFSGGVIDTQGVPPFYASGAFSFEVFGGETATIEFDDPVGSVTMFLVHRSGTSGTVRAFGRPTGGNPTGLLATVASQAATFFNDPTRFVTIAPGDQMSRLEIEATGNSATPNVFIDDLEWERDINHRSRISEFAVSGDPNVADPGSEKILLEVEQPQFNHDAGQLAFGPDGFLYISLGDGGAGSDVAPGHNPELGNGQDRTRVLGSVLRIDVDGSNSANGQYGIPADNPFTSANDPSGDVPDETWAYGFRNPWRFSFDDGSGGTGRLFLADVGQNLFEEVNLVEKGKNYGWNRREAAHFFDPANPTVEPGTGLSVGPNGEPLVDPIIEYFNSANPAVGPNDPNGRAAVGGFVYRGTALGDLVGTYVFGDWSRRFGQPDGSLFLAEETSPGVFAMSEVLADSGTGPARLSRFLLAVGEDEDGELYLLTNTTGTPFGSTGEVFKIVSSTFNVPTLSDWGIVAMTLGFLTAGIIVVARGRSVGVLSR